MTHTRIYFVGTHCSGKTTLARTIADRLSIHFQEESARQVLRENGWKVDDLRDDPDLVNLFQELVLERQFSNEVALSKTGIFSYSSDRAFDCMVYAAEHANNLYQLRHSQTWTKYLKLLKSAGSNIFFLRPSEELIYRDDPEREFVTWDGMQRIDAGIKFLLNYEGLTYAEIGSENIILEDRVNFVLENLIHGAIHDPNLCHYGEVI